MKFDFPGIILNDRLFPIEDLQSFSKEMIESDIPDWEKNIYRFIVDFLDDKDYIEQESSGTTGNPTLFKLSKKSMIESALRTVDFFNLKFAQSALLCLPIEYIAGKMMVVRSFVSCLNLFWEAPSSMPAIDKYGKIDFCAMVPLQVFNSFSNYEFIRNIKNLIIGGSELRPELIARFREVNNNAYETYGMAETCSHVALRKITGGNPDEYFKAIPGVEFELDDRGCLIIKADYLDNVVQTNDVVELINNQQFIWKGRYDNLINSGGVKVKPEELEAEIGQVLDLDFAIIGLPDKELGQMIVFVAESDKELNPEEILAVIKEVVSKHHIPKKFFAVKEFPRNKAFKIDRKKLVEMIS